MKIKFQLLLLVCLISLYGCVESGSDDKDREKPAPIQKSANLVLEAASLERGARVAWNQEAYPGATFNVCLSEERAGPGAEDCFRHKDAMLFSKKTSPLTFTGMTGGRRYWAQVEAEMPSGKTEHSRAVIVTALIADDELLGTDAYDWQSAPDLQAEKAAIASQSARFRDAMNNSDVQAASAVIVESGRDVYEVLFSNMPEAMPTFGEIVDQAQISFLSPPQDPSADFAARIAEYELQMDGFTFYVRWMKEGDTWLLWDF